MSGYFIQEAKKYAENHTKDATKIINAIGIFLIIFSLQIFFGAIKIIMPKVFSTDLAWLLSICLLAYYFKLQWKLAIIIAPMLYGLNYLAGLLTQNGPTKTAFQTFFLLLIFGIVAQFISYAYERSKTSLGLCMKQMLLSPLFLLAELFFYFSRMNELYYAIYDINQEAIDKKNRERLEENSDDDFLPPTKERRSAKRRTK